MPLVWSSPFTKKYVKLRKPKTLKIPFNFEINVYTFIEFLRIYSVLFDLSTGQLQVASPLPEQPVRIHARLQQGTGLPGRRTR